MKYCTKCGKEIHDEAVICPGCGCSTGYVANDEQKDNTTTPSDEISVGLCVLSVFVPLFGIIYWIVKHKETPKKARICGIAAIISAVLGFLIFKALIKAAPTTTAVPC